MIPTPKLFVLYNGKQPFDKTELKLSEAFVVPDQTPALEVIAKVVNIRYDKHNSVLSKSESVHGYSFLIDLIENNLRLGMQRDKAIETAVDECIAQGGLGRLPAEKFSGGAESV